MKKSNKPGGLVLERVLIGMLYWKSEQVKLKSHFAVQPVKPVTGQHSGQVPVKNLI